jgi:hypothetical protein
MRKLMGRLMLLATLAQPAGQIKRIKAAKSKILSFKPSQWLGGCLAISAQSDVANRAKQRSITALGFACTI